MPDSGTVDTLFTLDATGSTDPEDADSTLEARWDWEGDGTWDTEFSDTLIVTHQYGDTGRVTDTVEVRDSGGRTGIAAAVIVVAAGDTGKLTLAQIDLSNNKVIDIADVAVIAESFGQPASANPAADLNGNGVIDIADVAVIAAVFGQSVP